MPVFVVNKEACCHDDICLRVCPRALLKREKGQAPELPPEKEARCNLCGQCVAFCPKGCISLSPLAPERSQAVDPRQLISADQAMQFLKSRRSVRVFTPKPVPRSTIERVLETARMAPSGGNNQIVQWIVVEKPSAVRHLASLVAQWFDTVARQDPMLSKRYAIDAILTRFNAGVDVILRGAPHMVIAATPPNAAWGAVDSAIALTYFDLAASAHGLGCCWAGYFIRAVASSPPMRDYLGLAPDLTVQGAMVFGASALQSHQIPVRKPLTVSWL